VLVRSFTKSVSKGVTETKQEMHRDQAILKLILFVLTFVSAHVTVEIHLFCLVFQAAGSGAGVLFLTGCNIRISSTS